MERDIEAEALRIIVFMHPTGVVIPQPQPGQPDVGGVYPQMCIWIQTDDGDYFLEDKNLSGNPHDTNFLDNYVFHDLASYWHKYGRRFE